MPLTSQHRQKQVRLFLFVLAGAGILAVTSITINAITWLRLEENIRNLQSRRQLTEDWNVTMSLVQDIVIGQRGFLLTGETLYLQPFDEAIAALPGQWDDLKDGNSEDTIFLDRVIAAQALAESVITSARETIFLKRLPTQNPDASREAIQRGKVAMNELRKMLEEELHTSNEASFRIATQLRTDLQTGLISSIAIGISALGLGGTAFVLIRRILKEMRRTDRYAMERLRAEKAGEEKSSFLAMMSHEIRTPLNAILGFGELIGTRAKDPLTGRYANSIVSSGQALLQLLNDILDISKVDSGMSELQLAPVSLKELFRSVTRLFQETATKKQLILQTDLAEDLPDSFLLDESRLRQVLINLVSNAIKYTQGGEVRLLAQGEPDPEDRSIWNLRLTVADTGPGLSPDEQTTIFQPFVRNDRDIQSDVEGMGLGLSIVRRFVEFMQGEVTVQSHPGHGSTFTVNFKRVEVSNRLPIAAVSNDEPVDFDALEPSKILAVDDNQTNLELVRSIFLSSHHQVFVAANGKEALEMIETIEPDLVLMDIRMPEMDGVTALKAIRNERRHHLLPVIAVTASSRVEDDVPKRSGFDGSVRKPFSRRELYDQMAQFLAARTPDQSSEDHPATHPEDWITFRDALKGWKSSRWEALREEMTHSEVAKFAEDILQAATVAQCSPGVTYAEGLAEATEAFAFAEMEKRIDQFPQLIAQLDREMAS